MAGLGDVGSSDAVLLAYGAALEISRATAPFHAVLGVTLAVVVVILASRGSAPGDRSRSAIPAAVGAAALFLVPYVGLAWFIEPELPTLGGALLGGLGFVWPIRRAGPVQKSAAPAEERSALWAAAPYLSVVGLVLTTRLIPGLSDFLQDIEIDWELAGGFSGSFAPLYHPGTLLVGGLLIGALIQQRSWRGAASALRCSVGQVGPVVVALVAMLGLSRVMVAAGMVDTLAQAASDAAGDSWPVFAALVGAPGTFITGSGHSIEHAVYRLPGRDRTKPRGTDPAARRGAGIRSCGRERDCPPTTSSQQRRW